MSLPTVTDLKTHIGMTTAVDDEELVDHLDAAVDVVEGLIGPISEPGTVIETHRNIASDVLVLRSMPVGALVSVGYRVGASTSPLTLADYELDAASGLLRRSDGGSFHGSYTVTYTSGRSVLPASIRLAVLIVAAHLWETQRGIGPDPRALQDPTGDFGESGPFGVGYAVPNRAKDLLAPYVIPAIA